MEIRIDLDKYETTTQNDIVDILRSISKMSLHDYIWENGDLLSHVTEIDKDTDPVILAGKHGYDHRSNQLVSNQIGVQELPNRQIIKPGILEATLKRYNTSVSIILTYEASKQKFIEPITSKELRNACIYSIERAILYGTPTVKGLVSSITPYKKNYADHVPKAPQGSGTSWSVQGMYTMFYDYCENGYDLKNATFLCGTKAYAQLMQYSISGRVSAPIINFNDPGTPRIFGVPIRVMKCLDPEVILFGDFRLVFIRMLDLSEDVFRIAGTGGVRINYNSAFECGFADPKAFFMVKIAKTAHDNPA